MPRTIEFYYDFGSPASYIAHCRLKGVAARTGAIVELIPILLGAVFKATGNASPIECPAKGRYVAVDLMRFAARDGVPFASNPHFPINTTRLMRAATALRGDPGYARYVDFAFDAMWHFPRNLGDPAEMAAVLTNAGFDAEAVVARAASPEVKDVLRATTDAAIARGVFGAPTMFVGDEMWFGQDRVDWVEAAAA
ncbi:MAG: 2-hydroxychromene-2-carboxylate isomerase [Sphingomonadaceae bacterium]|nr:2-hydroxychromene-2-carboxylate isomerase [Sphingomonadaceae bacterium]